MRSSGPEHGSVRTQSPLPREGSRPELPKVEAGQADVVMVRMRSDGHDLRAMGGAELGAFLVQGPPQPVNLPGVPGRS